MRISYSFSNIATAIGCAALMLTGPIVTSSASQGAEQPDAKTGQRPKLNVTGKWITAPNGDVVILRGVNLVSKTSQSPEDLGFDDDNAALLAESGFNVVRLGAIWANIEPYLKPDGTNREYNSKYLASLNRTISLLAKYQIYTLVDFHQDAYAPPWGFGSPAWAVFYGGQNTVSVGFPGNVFGGRKPLLGKDPVQTDLITAFDAFWQNRKLKKQDDSLWKHYGEMLAYVAGYFSPQGGNIMGYDPINEPTPGSLWTEATVEGNPLDFSNGTPTFDKILGQFYETMIPQLRKGHPDATIWFESSILHGLGAKTYLPKLKDGNIGFNFHNYDKRSEYQAPVTNALAYQKTAGTPILSSEFGATLDTGVIDKVNAINDQNMISAIYWAYFNNPRYNFTTVPNQQLPTDPRKQAVVIDMSDDLTSPNVNTKMLTALTRVYPQRIAGTPLSFTFDPANKQFNLTYSTKKPNGQVSASGTRVVVPRTLYPSGYVATTNAGKITSGPNAQILVITNTDGGERQITVNVVPNS